MKCRFFIIILIVSSLCSNAAAGEASMEYLKNGMPCIFKRTKASRVIGVVCLVKTGAFYERPEQNGITSLVQSLLMKGSKKHTASELAIALESEGISMNTNGSEDYATLTAVATVDQLDIVLKLMSEILFQPEFLPEEIEKERENAIAFLRLRDDDKFHLTFNELRKILFKGHPYALPPEGCLETLSMINRFQIVEYHHQFYQPQNMILSLVGDIPPSIMKKSVNRYFGKIVAQDRTVMSFKHKLRPNPDSMIIKKTVEQGFISMGFTAVPMSHKDYAALRVACALLGEGMASRLFTRLRERQGLAYSVGSFVLNLKEAGAVIAYIGTRPDSIENATKRMKKIFKDLAKEHISRDELDRARNYIIGKYLIDHQTNIKKAFYLAWFEFFGLGYKFDSEYPEHIRSVTVRDIRRIARKYFKMPALVILTPEENYEKLIERK
jgi:zinc protease